MKKLTLVKKFCQGIIYIQYEFSIFYVFNLMI